MTACERDDHTPHVPDPCPRCGDPTGQCRSIMRIGTRCRVVQSVAAALFQILKRGGRCPAQGPCRAIVRYALTTVEVADQERQYYAGPIRKVSGRMAHKVTTLLEHATIFNTPEEAEAMRRELGSEYSVVPVDMELTVSGVDALVDAQLAAIADPALLSLIARLRVAPRREVRPWDYGEPHEYPCWIEVVPR
jgi:hypothetical protein